MTHSYPQSSHNHVIFCHCAGQGLFDPDIMESRVSTRWLQSIPTISPTTDYIPLNITIGYPGGALTFRHKFALDSQLTAADFHFSPGWLQLCSRYIPGVTLRLSDGSSLSIPVPNPGV